MRLLILSFYFPPDLSAGSFRAKALVDALLELSPDLELDVVTTAPNRYRTFARDAREEEADGRTSVKRIALPPHRSDMLGQARAFAQFARAAARHTAGQRYDAVFATSSRLMTAVLGARLARRSGAPLYLDIRDIFADTIGDVLPRSIARPLKVAFALLERWAIGRAARVNLVSQGFDGYFAERYPGRSFGFVTNGIDEEFVAAAPTGMAPARRDGPVRILYAGNVGEGQALHRIVPALAARLRDRATFVVVGDGGRRAALEAAVEGMANVELHAPVDREQLLGFYRDADVLFLHLGAVPAFEKVLPSKLFEYGALGKPVLAGVAGYAARFIRAELDNAVVFPPTDAEAAVRAFDTLVLETRPREAFVAKFARAGLARQLAADVLRVASQRR
jgi:glycosyltransferase involved in cell wall biosynthesis